MDVLTVFDSNLWFPLIFPGPVMIMYIACLNLRTPSKLLSVVFTGCVELRGAVGAQYNLGQAERPTSHALTTLSIVSRSAILIQHSDVYTGAQKQIMPT